MFLFVEKPNDLERGNGGKQRRPSIWKIVEKLAAANPGDSLHIPKCRMCKAFVLHNSSGRTDDPVADGSSFFGDTNCNKKMLAVPIGLNRLTDITGALIRKIKMTAWCSG
ncbi:hypothetical protein AB4Z52_24045 [Rhizobium sp. 2YAF20]|uniref:hypothetical protein n=1 Tax=Rhizobium sp. 2YAF20 TaxID=3233027 RepID=UPI003F98977D